MYPLVRTPDRIYERSTQRGKHKIFIGMAPGVGKTYRMLEEAHRLKQSGTDVVIGFLETHDRQDTIDKAIGLEVLPYTTEVRGGLIFRGLDVDAVLARQPKLALIDEVAQQSILKAEHQQCYQNIQAILAAGIDVYSTVNIQHLAHLSSSIAQLTGIKSSGRLPECFLQEADEVVVVDVTPETLEKRLLNGKIYPIEQIDHTTRSLFLRSRLAALRELALREVADQIEELREADHQCNGQATQSLCCIHERVLVCVSTHPNSLRLIQRGARLAACMNASLYVLFVRKPERSLSPTEARSLESCDRICQKFDGQFLQLTGDDPVEEIIKVATSRRITQIVLGQSHRSRWQALIQGSLINRLVRSLKQVDLHIISTKE